VTPSSPALVAQLPPVNDTSSLAAIRRLSSGSPRRKIIVLDDDPTGTQTVYDVPVLTSWEAERLAQEFDEPHPCFYILTNSRSLPPDAASELNREIGRNLVVAARGRPFTVISRSDSTLRGHFPVETDALNEVLGPFDATILLPYFEAGGRLTIDDIHYVLSNGELMPVAETPFSRDATFGYTHSNLRDWVEEKTCGRVRASEVHSVGIALLRDNTAGADDRLAARLLALPRGGIVVVNAADPRDVERFALAALTAENAGARFLYRTAAQFVAARCGLSGNTLLSAADFAHGALAHGGLVIVGSHVPQTTEQLRQLLIKGRTTPMELSVRTLVDENNDMDSLTRQVAAEVDARIRSGHDVVVYTSRDVVNGHSMEESLAIARRVSAALSTIAARLKVMPRFIIAKGGITSSDIATRGLSVRRAVVRGQIIRGVPVWRLGEESRFGGMDYVVFPGNVGGPDALIEVYEKLSRSRCEGVQAEPDIHGAPRRS
jgi:uncharacterized protein YgbK (DUF1537 family)